MVAPAEFAHRACYRVVIVATHRDFLLAEADVVVEIGIRVRAAGLEHVVVGVIKRQAVDEDMSVFVAVAVESLDR